MIVAFRHGTSYRGKQSATVKLRVPSKKILEGKHLEMIRRT